MLRAGRFRHRLLDDTFLVQQSALAHQCLQPFLHLWQEAKIGDPDMVAAYLTVFSFLRRPQDFLGGPHSKELPPNQAATKLSSAEFCRTLKEILPTTLQQQKSLRRLETDESLISIVTAHSLRSLPFSVNRALASWNARVFPLKVLTHIPSPREVLEMQAQGYRCISLLTEIESLRSCVEGHRDVFGFLVHDLIHADHFFFDSLRAQEQIIFCQKLLTLDNSPWVNDMRKLDPVFDAEWCYLISDMNSVTLHLLKTLKAIVLGSFKRSKGLDVKIELPQNLEPEFRALFTKFLVPWNLPAEDLEIAHRLNTPQYKGLQDSMALVSALAVNRHDQISFVC